MSNLSLPISVNVIVGSTNPLKIRAAQTAFETVYPYPNTVTVSGCASATPGITQWKSQVAIGQPFGCKQTAFGAIHRALDCAATLKQNKDVKLAQHFCVGYENGNVLPEEVGEQGCNGYDVGYVALYDVNRSQLIVKRAEAVKTELDVSAYDDDDSKHSELFDQSVREFQHLIMPKVQSKPPVDLYREWTANRKDGPQTRDYFLSKCTIEALHERQILEFAQTQIIDCCANSGMCASAGNRYRYMLWTRDLAYMAPIYWSRADYAIQFKQALQTIISFQKKEHVIVDNDYESINTFGQVPIVCIAPENEAVFLRQRLRGSLDDPSWQIQLYRYCEQYFPDYSHLFPPVPNLVSVNDVSQMTLDHLSLAELKLYYHNLRHFYSALRNQQARKIVETDNLTVVPPVPRNSFALKGYMENTLHQLTPGTRDSEIQFLRSVFQYCKATQADATTLAEFAPAIAKALFYLYCNVVDDSDGLPRGADSRDIFADILYDSKLLTNAVFLYQVLTSLVESCASLFAVQEFVRSAALASTAVQEASKQLAPANQSLHEGKLADHSFPESNLVQQIISVDQNLPEDKLAQQLAQRFLAERNRLHNSIQENFFFSECNFLRDFIPGPRALIALQNPIQPTPVADLVQQYQPQFVDGDLPDPQGLAYAVLTPGLVDPKHYSAILQAFQAADTEIGIAVFVPISGKTRAEEELLRQVQGRVVWPHVSWTVVRALLHMNTRASLHMAEQQRHKLNSTIGASSETAYGCAEWYAYWNGQVVPGGERKQGWSAAALAVATLGVAHA